ncbi:TonB-dependent receptor [Sphingomonas sp.]|uniref:TonB-dependent receptor n=1 Tax=Sphingomonas sp. TaxID=28214 RepID=UPI0025F1EA08|nr:TonB-dependent receptor [Sphingomonas sp.]
MIRTLAAALATSTCLVALASPAAAQTQEFNIPADSLRSALDTFARQSGRQVVYRGDEIRGAKSPGVRGARTAEEALDVLLAGTGFAVRRDSSGAFAVVRVGNATIGADDDAASPKTDKELAAEIVVTGTRIAGVETASPTITIGRKEIDRTGYSSTAQLIESIPQNFGGVSFDARFSDNASLLQGSNLEGASSIDLRGLGAQSTLVLVNGQRRAPSLGGRAVDINSIPLTAVERVEIASGGRSAIYGADAVAGVVNFVLKRKFSGFQTDFLAGKAEHGAAEYQLSQTAGIDHKGGGFLINYTHSQQDPLDIADTPFNVSPSVVNSINRTLFIVPESNQDSVYFSGEKSLSPVAKIYADVLYSNRKAINKFDIEYNDYDYRATSSSVYRSTDLSVNAGLDISLSPVWNMTVSGLYDRRTTNYSSSDVLTGAGVGGTITSAGGDKNSSTLWGFTGTITGSLPTMFGIEPKLALGAEYRTESNVIELATLNRERDVASAFAELSLPLIGGEGRPFMRRLDLSLAGRIDNYSDAGSTANPQVGLIWEPGAGLTAKASYSTSFRAADLVTVAASRVNPPTLFIRSRLDPTSSTGSSLVLEKAGTDPNIGPETAKTWTASLEFKPRFAPWIKFFGSFTSVDYRNRIIIPLIGSDAELVLVRQNLFGNLINRNPGTAAIDALQASTVPARIRNLSGIPFNPATQQISQVFPGIVLVSNQLQNVALEQFEALDFGFDAASNLGRLAVNAGLNGTYILRHREQITGQSPSFSLLNELGKSPDFRFRANAGIGFSGARADVFVNHVRGYSNPLSTPVSWLSSWTTVDLSVSYEAPKADSRWLTGWRFSLNATNLFNTAPPQFLDGVSGIAFDSANANGLGRQLTLRISKRW